MYQRVSTEECKEGSISTKANVDINWQQQLETLAFEELEL